MARLKSHGTELLRRELETEVPDDELITWRRFTRTYHSDGTVLQKHDVRFKPSQFHNGGEFYSYGWKIFGKLKTDATPQVHCDRIVANMKANNSKWRIVSGGPAPVILNMELVMRAAQSDESIGFCRECGAEQGGVEPDARGYKCESCGALEVYGAEEILIGA